MNTSDNGEGSSSSSTLDANALPSAPAASAAPAVHANTEQPKESAAANGGQELVKPALVVVQDWDLSDSESDNDDQDAEQGADKDADKDADTRTSDKAPIMPPSDPEHTTVISWRKVKDAFSCSICLQGFRKTVVVKACLHRFCDGCIRKSLRLANRECPTCRTPCPSRRSTRPDERMDALLAAIVGDVEAFEAREQSRVEGMLEPDNLAVFQASMQRGMERQATTKSSRVSQAKILHELERERRKKEPRRRRGSLAGDRKSGSGRGRGRPRGRPRGSGGTSSRTSGSRSSRRSKEPKVVRDASQSRAHLVGKNTLSLPLGELRKHVGLGEMQKMDNMSVHGFGDDWTEVPSRIVRRMTDVDIAPPESKPHLQRYKKYKNHNKKRRDVKRLAYLPGYAEAQRGKTPRTRVPSPPASSYTDSGSPSSDNNIWTISGYQPPPSRFVRKSAVRTMRMKRRSQTGKRVVVSYHESETYSYSYTFGYSSGEITPTKYDSYWVAHRIAHYSDTQDAQESGSFGVRGGEILDRSRDLLLNILTEKHAEEALALPGDNIPRRTGNVGGSKFVPKHTSADDVDAPLFIHNMLSEGVTPLLSHAPLLSDTPPDGVFSFVFVSATPEQVSHWNSHPLELRRLTQAVSEATAVQGLPQITNSVATVDVNVRCSDLAKYLAHALKEEHAVSVSAQWIRMAVNVGDGSVAPLRPSFYPYSVCLEYRVAFPIVITYCVCETPKQARRYRQAP